MIIIAPTTLLTIVCWCERPPTIAHSPPVFRPAPRSALFVRDVAVLVRSKGGWCVMMAGAPVMIARPHSHRAPRGDIGEAPQATRHVPVLVCPLGGKLMLIPNGGGDSIFCRASRIPFLIQATPIPISGPRPIRPPIARARARGHVLLVTPRSKKVVCEVRIWTQ